jgi:hypothetical protein
MNAGRWALVCVLVVVAVTACSKHEQTAAPSSPAAAGTANPSDAKRFEGVWRIDLQASGLPGYGNSPPQLTPWGEEQRDHHRKARAAGDLSFDLTARCSSPGMPRIMTLPDPLQIIARADTVTMIFAWNHLFRLVNLDAQHRYEASYPMAMGAGNGVWEGQTLRVRTSGRHARTLLDDSIPNSEGLEVSETLSVSADGGTLTDVIVSSDPKVLASPWQRTFIYRKQQNGDINDNDSCLDRIAAGQPAVPPGY